MSGLPRLKSRVMAAVVEVNNAVIGSEDRDRPDNNGENLHQRDGTHHLNANTNRYHANHNGHRAAMMKESANSKLEIGVKGQSHGYADPVQGTYHDMPT